MWGGSVPKTCSRLYQKVVFGNNNPQAGLYRKEGGKMGGRKQEGKKEMKTIN